MENPPLRTKLRLTILAAGLAGLATMHGIAYRWRTTPVVLESVEDDLPAAPPTSEPIADVTPAPPPPHERRLRFRDGSVAHLASAETEVNPTSVHEQRIVSELVAGGARFEIARRPSRVFRVTAGAVSVEATAATVELERRDTRLGVRVLDGRVRVAWADGRRQLGSGDQGVFPPGRAADRSPRRAGSPGDVSIARLSEDEDELAALLTKADQARARRRFKEAANVLRAAAAKDASDPRRAVAEFRLGCLLLENLSQPRQAATAFARSRSLAPDGPLAADALAREVEARAVSGERGRAQALAREYLASDATAPYAAWVRRWSGLD